MKSHQLFPPLVNFYLKSLHRHCLLSLPLSLRNLSLAICMRGEEDMESNRKGWRKRHLISKAHYRDMKDGVHLNGEYTLIWSHPLTLRAIKTDSRYFLLSITSWFYQRLKARVQSIFYHRCHRLFHFAWLYFCSLWWILSFYRGARPSFSWRNSYFLLLFIWKF